MVNIKCSWPAELHTTSHHLLWIITKYRNCSVHKLNSSSRQKVNVRKNFVSKCKYYIFILSVILLEAVVQRCSVKTVILEISQNFQENLDLRPTTLLKKRLWRRCFPVNFVIFLRTPFYIEHLWWLLPYYLFSYYLLYRTCMYLCANVIFISVNFAICTD